MKVTVNGKAMKTARNTTLSEVVLLSKVKAEDVVIVRNEAVVKRHLWASTLLVDGDTLELVSLIDDSPHTK